MVKSRRPIKNKEFARTAQRWRAFAQVAVIVLVTGIVYLPALQGGFVWDDELLISKNPLLTSWSGLGEIWGFGRTPDYFPLTNTVFWIERHLFGESTFPYHIINIVLHIANALLVWFVLRRLNIPGAWLAGLIFAVHPVHVESVAWISELKNVLSLFWALISVWLLVRFIDGDAKRPMFVYLLSLGSFILALLAKTQVVFLPVALLVCMWWRTHAVTKALDQPRSSNRPTKSKQAISRSSFLDRLGGNRAFVAIVPFFAVAIILGIITIAFQSRGLGEEEVVLGPFSRRLTNAGMAVWWYAKQVFLPIRLMTVYPRWRFDSPTLMEWLPLVTLITVVLVLWFWPGRERRSFFFALAYFIVALLPVVGLVRMAYPRSGTLVADHFQYFADLSLIALFSVGIARVWASRRHEIAIASGVLTFLLIGAMGSYTWARASVYRNEETLWRDNFSKNPDAWQGHNRIGQVFFDQKKFDEAAQHFERAVQLKPELSDNYNQLGLTYCRLNRFDEGIAEYRKGLRLKEEKSSTANTSAAATMRTNLANALTITGNNFNELAQRHSAEGAAIAAEADRKEAMGRYGEAISEYEKALAIAPDHPAIHRNLGVLLASLGRKHEAVVHLRKVLQLVPNEALARETLDAIEAEHP
jgi:protein O-mannosyl-transferase